MCSSGRKHKKHSYINVKTKRPCISGQNYTALAENISPFFSVAPPKSISGDCMRGHLSGKIGLSWAFLAQGGLKPVVGVLYFFFTFEGVIAGGVLLICVPLFLEHGAWLVRGSC